MAGFIIVEHAGPADDADLAHWLQMARDYSRLCLKKSGTHRHALEKWRRDILQTSQ